MIRRQRLKCGGNVGAARRRSAAGILAVTALSFGVRHWAAGPRPPLPDGAVCVRGKFQSERGHGSNRISRIEQRRRHDNGPTTTSIAGERALALLSTLGVAPERPRCTRYL